MIPDKSEENKIPIRKSNNLEQKNFDPPQKKWRIVDLAESQNSGGGSKKEYNVNYKSKSKLSLRAMVGGIFNLILVFGLGAVIYFGWVYYKNNYSGAFPPGEKKEASKGDDAGVDDPAKSLGERLEEIKDSLSPDSATTTDSSEAEEELKTMLKVLDNRVGYLNIRKAPSLSGEIIGKAKPQNVYEYINVKDNWYNIVLTDSSEGAPSDGWVHGDYIEIIEEEVIPNNVEAQTQPETSSSTSATSTASQANLVKITSTPTGYLNVRNSPRGTIIGKVYPGEEYVYTDSRDNWYFLVIADKEGKDVSGWVSGEYVEEI